MQEIDTSQIPQPEAWSVFLGDGLGRWLIFAGFVLYLLSALGWMASPKNERLKKAGGLAFTLGSVCVFGAFAILGYLFVGDHFEYKYIYEHSDKLNTLQYQISAIWSGQQGSFMLWTVCSAIFGLLTVRGAGPYRRWYTVVYALFLMSLCGVMAYESAFNLHEPLHGVHIKPEDGVGLVPSLLNYWMTIHPPTIFLGFGSLTVLFAYAVAALVEKDPVDWVSRVRPWSIVSLTLVGVGLCMGGFWAYETLGWGGFWMWDPVENTSFVPWLFLAILVHGFIIQQARKRWHLANIVLAAMPFIAFIYGTFLTRSGFLSKTSVHSFAQMDNKALYLLIGMGAAFILGFAGLCVWRGKAIRSFSAPRPAQTGGIARESVYTLGSYTLGFLAIAVAVGMSVPLIQALMHKDQKVVEEALYHKVLVWPFFPIMLLMAAAPFIGWRGTSLKELLNKLYLVLCVTIFLTGCTLVAIKMSSANIETDFDQKIQLVFGPANATLWTMILAGLCYFAVVAHAWRAIEMYRKNRPSVASFMSHVGLGLALAGLIISRGMETKVRFNTHEDIPGQGLGYTANFLGSGDPFQRQNKVKFRFFNDKDSFVAEPSVYMRRVWRQGPDGQPVEDTDPVVWPYIHRGLFHDLYVTAYPSFSEAGDAMSLAPGGKTEFPGYTIEYEGMTMDGNPGQTGTKFVANVKLTDEKGNTISVKPSLTMTEQGLRPDPAPIDQLFYMQLERIDAGSKSATLQMYFYKPVWPIEAFHKPFVGLVWLGTGIMALAGIFAALNRRSRRATPAAESAQEEGGSSPEPESNEDASESPS